MSIKTLEEYSPANYFYNIKDKLQAHIYKRADRLFREAEKARERIKTKEEFEAYIEEKRRKFIDSMGGIPYDGARPLNARTTGIIEEENLIIENVIYEAREKVYVTANLYIPKKRKNPCGAVLFQCGHSEDGKFYPQYQNVARIIAYSGVIVLLQDPPGQGERANYYEPSIGTTMIGTSCPDHQYSGIQCYMTGDSSVRYFIADAMKSIDYLMSRPEVDKERIGLTGSSGGGTMTVNTAICDKRIAAAAPGTFVMTRESYMKAGGTQDAEQIWLSCAEYGFDHHEALMCAAPKPYLILAVNYDAFPIEGTEEVYSDVKRFWEMYGKGGNLRLFRDDSVHCFTENLARQAGRFFAEVLNGEDVYFEGTVKPLSPKALSVTKSGYVRGEIEGARFIFDENLDRFMEKKPEKDIREWLSEKINKDRQETSPNLRILEPLYENGLIVNPYVWFTQKDLPVWGLYFRSMENDGKKLPLTLCLWDKGTDDIENNIEKIRSICKSSGSCLVCDISGVGKCMPYKLYGGFEEKGNFGILDGLNKVLIAMGDSLCALRLYDLIRTVEMLRSLDTVSEVKIFAKGYSAVYARHAKILDETLDIETSDEVSIIEKVTERYYASYNIASVAMPEIAVYSR